MWSRHGRSFLSIVLNEVAKRKASQYRDAFPARFELLSSMKLRSVKLRNCRLFRRLVLLHQFLNEVAKRKASQYVERSLGFGAFPSSMKLRSVKLRNAA